MSSNIDKELSLAVAFYNHFQFPKSSELFVKISKKMLTENTELNSVDKSIVKDVLKSIEWRYTLKAETVNIPVFKDEIHEYYEIAVLHITVKNLYQTKQLCKLLHSQIPYPTLLVLEFEGAIAISLADKTVNQTDNSKLVIQYQYDTGWLTHEMAGKSLYKHFLLDMCFQNCSLVSLYDFYQDLIKKINLLEAGFFTGVYEPGKQTNLSNEQLTCQLVALKKLESKLNTIRNEIKKETQMNAKMYLNVEAKKVKDSIGKLKRSL